MTESMRKDLLKRYEKASSELVFFITMRGVSDRFSTQLGLKQSVKKANSIDDMIQEQIKQLEDSLGQESDLGVAEAGLGGAWTPKTDVAISDDKRKVQQARDRVFLRSLQHIEKAIELIQNSQIYSIKTSDEARRLKLQQRRVSAFKIVEELDVLRKKVEAQRANLARVQKITLSPTFEAFLSRSQSPRVLARRSKSATRSKSSTQSAGRSRSRSRSKSATKSPKGPGRFITDPMTGEEIFLPMSPSAVEHAKQTMALATRFRTGYNF